MDGQDEYTFALNKFDELEIKRNDPSFWADNLIQATKDLKNPIAWRNFYAVLGNADHKYSDEKNVRTLHDWLGDHKDGVVDMNDTSNVQFTEKRVENGNVVHIRLTPNINEYIAKQPNHGQEIEPVDFLPEIVESPEEKCREEPPRIDEIGRVRIPQDEICSSEDEKNQD